MTSCRGGGGGASIDTFMETSARNGEAERRGAIRAATDNRPSPLARRRAEPDEQRRELIGIFIFENLDYESAFWCPFPRKEIGK